MKHLLKKITLNSGAFQISSWFNRELLTILAYHCLSPQNNGNGFNHFDGKQLKLAEFENHLRIITKYSNPISLEEAIVNPHLPPHPVVLTFDDGYQNNYTYAFPLLKKYNIPASIFVTTGFIDQINYIWLDQLEFIIDKAPSENIDFSWKAEKLTLKLNSYTEKVKSIRAIKNYVKALPESQRLSLIEKLQQILEIEYDWSKIPTDLLPLTWDEIREMKESNIISIGSHTVTHPILSQCTYEQQKKELLLSKQRISEEIGEKCNLFAYPNGRGTDYNQVTIRLLKELNYLGAVTMVHGYISNKNKDNFQLNRFGGDISFEALGTIVSGLSRLVGTI